MGIGGAHAEILARKVKGVDLAATVAQQLEGAHRAATHAIEIFRRLAFAVDLLLAVERDLLGCKPALAGTAGSLSPVVARDETRHAAFRV